MNQLFLLKLIADLIKSDKPTIEEIKCARTIVENLIKAYDKPTTASDIMESDLDPDAEAARRELL